MTTSLGAIAMAVGKQVRHTIKTAGQFFRLFYVWGLEHVAAGSLRVAIASTDPTAETVGSEGNLPDKIMCLPR
jgi:hypothetical protein